MIAFKKVYRVGYDLAVNGRVQREDDGHPLEVQFVLAENFEEAMQIAKAIAPELRQTAVHRELVIREIALELADVVVGVKEGDR